MVKTLLLGLLAVLSIVQGAAAAPADWIAAWGAAPVEMHAAARFTGRTVRQVVRVSAGGAQVRIRLSNAFGAAPLQIGAAHIAVAGADGSIAAGSDRGLTFDGASTAVIAPGAVLVSDPASLNVAPLASLAVSLYLPAAVGACACHPVALETGFLSPPGDFTSAADLPTANTFEFRAILTGVDIRPQAGGKTIIALGDSLTDGVGSTSDEDRRWPDRLAERLVDRDGYRRAWGVVNAGIGGNRLLSGGTGPPALARLEEVLATPGAAYLILFEGVNDLGFARAPPPDPGAPPGPSPIAKALIAGYQQIIARAHKLGLKVYGATLAPYGGAFYYTAQGEADRQAINDWIRTSGAYDGVIDVDAVWRDPAQPSRIQRSLQVGDRLHGNDAGYRALGDAIDLDLFR